MKFKWRIHFIGVQITYEFIVFLLPCFLRHQKCALVKVLTKRVSLFCFRSTNTFASCFLNNMVIFIWLTNQRTVINGTLLSVDTSQNITVPAKFSCRLIEVSLQLHRVINVRFLIFIRGT